MLFCNSLSFSMIQRMLAIWFLVPLPFLNPAWTSGSSQYTYCWNLAWSILSFTLLVCEMNAVVWQFECSLALPFLVWGSGKQHEFKRKVEGNLACVCTRLCPALYSLMDCGPRGSSVYGIFQARILEWVVISSSRGSSQPRDRTCTAGGFFTTVSSRKPIIWMAANIHLISSVLCMKCSWLSLLVFICGSTGHTGSVKCNSVTLVTFFLGFIQRSTQHGASARGMAWG